MRILLVDNYDSFTYNLYDYLLQAGAECDVVRNTAITADAFDPGRWQGLVFSPGPKRPSDAGAMMELIRRWHQQVPMLGICLGHQALGEFFGARLVQARQPVHGKTSLLRHNGHALFSGLPPAFTVMRYHSLLLESLAGTPLQALAHTPDGEIMALAHPDLPLYGVQFHPESILTEHGLELLRNWLLVTNISPRRG
jgi:anthranilate synthase/aminodeoxychorismate synthase-like glutamine amidotransferase